MLSDALLAFLHYLSIFGLVGALTAEAVVLRPGMTPSILARLMRYDAVYFLMAILTLGTGVGRLLMSPKGLAFYMTNPWFHAKIGLFVLIALLSIKPTLTFFRWKKQARRLPDFVPLPAELAKTRRWVMLEAHLLIFLPLCAALMARGIGMG
ncbi:DUF2214 family protein [Imbroritus primus]|uniref:DUF2214 family protein n=1 Tax=Imbroritus primus TaxID=3058603 RepID=A0ACD3SKX0_9BURK|nr:DUF2214 family protein [Burkholderiaceae bacterium PBA]